VKLPTANAVAVVDDVVFRGMDDRLEVVGADGLPALLVTLPAGDRILRLAANPRWITWLVRRGADVLLFASPFARTSAELAPVLLETRAEPKLTLGEIYLGSDHAVFEATLFRLRDRARWSLGFLNAPGRGGPLSLAGLTTDSVYWLDGHLRRVAYSDLGDPAEAKPSEDVPR
jgi:hypothetical protein